jgi:hypothetical protein
MYKTDVGVRIVLSPISWYVIIMSFLVSAIICDLCGIGDTYILFITKEAHYDKSRGGTDEPKKHSSICATCFDIFISLVGGTVYALHAFVLHSVCAGILQIGLP